MRWCKDKASVLPKLEEVNTVETHFYIPAVYILSIIYNFFSGHFNFPNFKNVL